MAHAIERVTVADEDAEGAAWRRGRNPDGNLAHDALTTIGAKHGFDDDFIARAGFGDVRACGFETRPPAIGNEIDVQFYTVDLWLLVGVVEDAAKAFAKSGGDGGGGRRIAVAGGVHVVQFQFRVAGDVDRALDAEGSVFAVLINTLDGAVNRRHHGDRREARIVQDFEVESLRVRDAVKTQRDRNHLGLLAEAAENAGVAILHEGADLFGGGRNFEGVGWRGQRREYRRFCHRHIDIAEVHQRVAAREKMGGVHVGDGASGSNVHVAADEDSADRRTGLDGLRLLGIFGGADAHHRDDARGGELGRETLYCVSSKAGENQWSVDRSQGLIRCRDLRIDAGTAGGFRRFGTGSNRRRKRRLRRVHLIDFEHFLDRRHTSNGFLRKFPNAVRDGADKFAVDVNRASAHSGNYTGEIGFCTVKANEDDVTFGPGHVAKNAKDLYAHGFGLNALEYGIGGPCHADFHLAQWHDGDTGFFSSKGTDRCKGQDED